MPQSEVDLYLSRIIAKGLTLVKRKLERTSCQWERNTIKWIVSECAVIHPGLMPRAKITSYKPTYRYLSKRGLSQVEVKRRLLGPRALA